LKPYVRLAFSGDIETNIRRQFYTNDRMLRYNRLSNNMFTDTLESGTLLRRQSKFAQVFAVAPNWIKVYSRGRRMHHCLSTHFHEVGDPEKMIMDGSKEQTHGEILEEGLGTLHSTCTKRTGHNFRM
jgi:hypothetical protein